MHDARRAADDGAARPDGGTRRGTGDDALRPRAGTPHSPGAPARAPRCATAHDDRASAGAEEDGSTLLLILVYALIATLLALVLASATSLFLEHKRLLSLADGAALAASEAYDIAATRVTASGVEPVLDPAAAALAANRFVDRAPVLLDGVRVESVVTPDAVTAVVAVSSAWHPPVFSFVVPEGFRVHASSSARGLLE